MGAALLAMGPLGGFISATIPRERDMRLINYGLLALGLVLAAGCEKPQEPAAQTAPATAEAPAPAPAASEQTPAPAPETALPSAPTAPALLAPAPATATTCPTGCTLMNCPPPTGPLSCCKRTPTGYQQCTL